MNLDDFDARGGRPRPFEFYTAADLWTDEHTSKQMLRFHLDPDVDLSSRRKEFIDRSVEWITSYFEVGPGTRVADFGCGPGLYTNRLAEQRAVVTGIDFSERSLRHAREVAGQEGLSVRYVLQNYLDYDTDDRFDLVLMIFCDFCALGPAQRETMLRKFHAFLKPGGAVLLDVHSLNVFESCREKSVQEPELMDGFWSAGEYDGYLDTFRYEDEKVSLDRYTLVESGRVRTVYNWLQYYSPESLRRELATAGFEVELILSDVAGTPYDADSKDIAIIARKPHGTGDTE